MNDTITFFNQVSNNLLQGISLADLFSAFIFAFIGVVLRWIYITKKAIKKTDNHHPNSFNLIYWITDSWLNKLKNLLGIMLALYISIVFAPYFGAEFNMYYAFGIGLGLDLVLDKIIKIKAI